MPPRKRTTAPVHRPTPPVTLAANTSRKVTRTLTVAAGLECAVAIAQRTDPPMQWQQVDATFEAERIAGPRDTNARWRFSVPGQMLVVAEADLPIIEALINALKVEQEAAS